MMYIAHYDIPEIESELAFHQMPVDTIEEAIELVRERCAYLLAVIYVKVEHRRGMVYHIFVNSNIRGIVRIRKSI